MQEDIAQYISTCEHCQHVNTTLTPPKNVELNAKIPRTATNSTIPILSPYASGSPSTSKFVACSTTVTLPIGHPTQTNPVVDRTRHNMVTYPIATFSACSGQLVHSSGPTVTLPISHMVENMATVLTTSVINTNMYKLLHLSIYCSIYCQKIHKRNT